MGTLKSVNRRCALAARHLVGRHSLAHLQLPSPAVSGEHASLYFVEGVWKLRDLGSRNGTFVNGRRIPLQRSVALAAGDEIRFGGEEEPPWVLADDGAPAPAALGPDRQRVVGGARGLWLPNPDQPVLRVQWSTAGWVLQSPAGIEPTRDGARVLVEGLPWTLELPPTFEEHPTDEHMTTLQVDGVAAPLLRFSVSLDEEHVNIEAHQGEATIALGARAHNYTLLVLARKRIADASNGVAATECGWVYVDELRRQLQLDRGPFNLQLWRASQWLSKLGLPGDQLIERRDDSRQIRIGFESALAP